MTSFQTNQRTGTCCCMYLVKKMAVKKRGQTSKCSPFSLEILQTGFVGGDWCAEEKKRKTANAVRFLSTQHGLGSVRIRVRKYGLFVQEPQALAGRVVGGQSVDPFAETGQQDGHADEQSAHQTEQAGHFFEDHHLQMKKGKDGNMSTIESIRDGSASSQLEDIGGK